METFQHANSLKGSVKLSDLFGKGTTFEFDSNDNEDYAEDLDFSNFPGSEEHLIPVDLPFNELKEKMKPVAQDVWKRVYKEAKPNATQVDLSRHRVTYHRNLYMECEVHPFDSTYLNGKPDTISANQTQNYLEGILDALSTMQLGEQSYFIVSYRKMFKEKGCEPRVMPYADILCDLKVIKIEEVGDQDIVDELKNLSFQRSFEEAKTIFKEVRICAKNLFENRKVEAASKKYEQLLQLVEFCKTENGSEEREKTEMRKQLLTNLAVCYNLRQEPNKTMSMVRQIEAIDDVSKNAKVLFIKGKALRMLGDLKAAMIALSEAKKIAPYDKKILDEMEILVNAIYKDKEAAKKFSQNLFAQSKA